MQYEDGNFIVITQLLEKLYELNRRGHYTVWFDWSGHTNGIYIKIIKGNGEKIKKKKLSMKLWFAHGLKDGKTDCQMNRLMWKAYLHWYKF